MWDMHSTIGNRWNAWENVVGSRPVQGSAAMRAKCLCGHGWGSHQHPDPLFFSKDGTIKVWPHEWEAPLVCCDRECDCEEYRERRARWRRATGMARVDCWIGENGLPVCGKAKNRQPYTEAHMEQHSYESRDWCVGCRRWLEEHPEAFLQLESAGS